MNRSEAYHELMKGERLRHKSFTEKEYIEVVDGVITTEDGYTFEEQFHFRLTLEEDWEKL